jgi:hypothetical protein
MLGREAMDGPRITAGEACPKAPGVSAITAGDSCPKAPGVRWSMVGHLGWIYRRRLHCNIAGDKLGTTGVFTAISPVVTWASYKFDQPPTTTLTHSYFMASQPKHLVTHSPTHFS